MSVGRIPGASGIPTTTVLAKGDLIAGTAANAVTNLSVGSDGQTLVADSSATTGLRYQAPKSQNAVYNSGFDVWQRGTSVATGNGSAGTAYTADRWQSVMTAGAMTTSRQATGDTTNLPNIQYCARVQRNSGTTSTAGVNFIQTLETTDSIRFTGQTVTFSFYARAGANFSSASNLLGVNLYYGTGTDQNVIYTFTGATAVINTTKTLTTTWQRFTATATVSTASTEIGYFFNYTPVGTAGTNDYFEITGVQLEVGSVATPFNRMSGTLQGELAACQRYYYRNSGLNIYSSYAWGWSTSTTNCAFIIPTPVQMRVVPNTPEIGNLQVGVSGGSTYAASSPSINAAFQSPNTAYVEVTVPTITSNLMVKLFNANNAAGYIGFSAEL